MSYYAITGNEIAIADKVSSLTPYYKNIKELPADYYDRCYIVSGGELIIDEVAEKEKALTELDAQYDSDKATLMNYFTQALFAGDEEEQEQLKAEMEEIDAQYIEDRKALELEGDD